MIKFIRGREFKLCSLDFHIYVNKSKLGKSNLVLVGW